MRRYVLQFAALLLPTFTCIALAQAQPNSPNNFAGTWVMRLGERNLFVITIVPAADGIAGTFDRPEHLSSTNSIFANIGNAVRQDKIVRARVEAGVLHFTVRNSEDASDEDDYAMSVDGNEGTLARDGLPPTIVIPPARLIRVTSGTKVSTDWQANRIYTGDDSDIPSKEMKAIFDEDQQVRQSQQVDWKTVTRSDADRREATRKLMDAGALHTGRDFEEAAFVFQHGDSPQDYLLAHTLAMIAASKGDPTAIWIASATLDRYLQSIGQKQIFGTQFKRDADGKWTQDPYDRDLLSDAIRAQAGVPDQSNQQKQLKAYQDQN